VIDKHTDFFGNFSELFSELITALGKVLFKSTRMKFPLFWWEKTTHTIFEMWYSFFELENSYSERKMVVISNEIRLIIGYIVSTKHRELYRKSHIIHVALFPYLAQIFPSFLYFSLSEKCDTEILHDEHIIRSYRECSLEEDDSFFYITGHGICPSEIPENFRIIWTLCIRLFEAIDSFLKIIANERHVTSEIQSC
jgi:hypothetical protein